MTEPYEFVPKRIQDVLEQLHSLTSKKPQQVWEFRDLKRERPLFAGVMAFGKGPIGGDDFRKYSKFAKLEELIKGLDEELTQAAYMGTHRGPASASPT